MPYYLQIHDQEAPQPLLVISRDFPFVPSTMTSLPLALETFISASTSASDPRVLRGLATENFVIKSLSVALSLAPSSAQEALITAISVIDPNFGVDGSFQLLSRQLEIFSTAISTFRNYQLSFMKRIARCLFDGASLAPAVRVPSGGGDAAEAARYGEAAGVVEVLAAESAEFAIGNLLRSSTAAFRRILGSELWAVVASVGSEISGVSYCGSSGVDLRLQVTEISSKRPQKGRRIFVVTLHSGTSPVNSGQVLNFQVPLTRQPSLRAPQNEGVLVKLDVKRLQYEVQDEEGVLEIARISWALRGVLFGVSKETGRWGIECGDKKMVELEIRGPDVVVGVITQVR